MLLLSGDVLLHRFEIRLAHGEIRVAALPLEVGVFTTAFLQPEVRDAFQFLHPFGLREGASEVREQMDVAFHAADEEGRAIELFGDAAEIRVQRGAPFLYHADTPGMIFLKLTEPEAKDYIVRRKEQGLTALQAAARACRPFPFRPSLRPPCASSRL